MLIAHRASLAAQLSALFRDHQINKEYRAWVLGKTPSQGVIDTPLDGRRALTRYRLLQHDAASNQSLLQIEIDTGRTHQIRRHLNDIGHPVIGDPRYGKGNKNERGLQLVAVGLAFHCPLRRQPVSLELSDEFLSSHSRWRTAD